jgi:hypothetical protein
MGARGVKNRAIYASIVGALLTACGGASTRNGVSDGDGGSASGGSGAVGSAGAGAGATPQWLVDVKLEEMFPWFVQEAGGPYGMVSDDGDESLVHVTLDGAPVAAVVSTHNHFEVVSLVQAAAFRAKASRELTVRVSVTGSIGFDYFAERDAGMPWPSAAVTVSPSWQSFAVPLADMMPPELLDPQRAPAFQIAFIVEAAMGPVELWLDDVHFE